LRGLVPSSGRRRCRAESLRVLLTWWAVAAGVHVVVAWACGVVGATPVSHGVVVCVLDVVGSDCGEWWRWGFA
jgi:hypothetical protein